MSVRLAQIFDMSDGVPTKASLYLKRVGANGGLVFDLSDGSFVIDATNFSELTQDDNKLAFDDRISGYTGNGYLIAQQLSFSGDWGRATYPIRTDNPGKKNLYLRVQSQVGVFRASIFIDGERVVQLATAVAGPTWTWITTSFVLPDTETHDLSIRIEDHESAVDKVYIDEATASPTGDGPDYSVSPFVTLHLQVYEATSSSPTDPLFVYAYKTTLAEVTIDDWYNFGIAPLDGSTAPYSGWYALVLSSTGSHPGNFVLWELVDNDEYLMLPSALKVRDA